MLPIAQILKIMMDRSRVYGAPEALSDNPEDTPEARETKRRRKLMNRTGVQQSPHIEAMFGGRGFLGGK